MDKRESAVREGFSGLVRSLLDYFDQLRRVERGLPPPGPAEADDEDDFFTAARAALECARGDHLEPLLQSLAELATPDVQAVAGGETTGSTGAVPDPTEGGSA